MRDGADAVGLVKFVTITCAMTVVVTMIVIYGLYFAINRKKLGILGSLNRLFGENGYSLEFILLCELVFLGIFLLITWFLGGKVSSTETERLMNYGFLNMLNKCEYLPPKDMWAAMENINYYYYPFREFL